MGVGEIGEVWTKLGDTMRTLMEENRVAGESIGYDCVDHSWQRGDAFEDACSHNYWVSDTVRYREIPVRDDCEMYDRLDVLITRLKRELACAYDHYRIVLREISEQIKTDYRISDGELINMVHIDHVSVRLE
jgi:hypothetical protein